VKTLQKQVSEPQAVYESINKTHNQIYLNVRKLNSETGEGKKSKAETPSDRYSPSTASIFQLYPIDRSKFFFLDLSNQHRPLDLVPRIEQYGSPKECQRMKELRDSLKIYESQKFNTLRAREIIKTILARLKR
jgi:hypothetical protein